jgi:hypothetical protein
MAEILQGGKRDNLSLSQFAVTNITEDYSLDCNANADLSTADVLGTLIRELIRAGIINGTVA